MPFHGYGWLFFMNFAERQLQKYGWTPGKGLGKHENGTVKAVSVAFKSDTVGVGAKEKEWENWWEQAFNKTASSIDISAPGKAPQSSLNTRDATSKPLTSGPSFISEREIVQQSSDIFLSVKPLSDQELFRICEGRTAHKGARSCMAGKLKRAKQIGSGLPEIGDKYSDSDVHGISSNDKNNPCITSYSPKISRKHRRHSKNDGKMKKAKRKK